MPTHVLLHGHTRPRSRRRMDARTRMCQELSGRAGVKCVTKKPTDGPSRIPTHQPTPVPSPSPTSEPTAEPTFPPTPSPTHAPTHAPTHSPTSMPTDTPVVKVEKAAAKSVEDVHAAAEAALKAVKGTSTSAACCVALHYCALGWDAR